MINLPSILFVLLFSSIYYIENGSAKSLEVNENKFQSKSDRCDNCLVDVKSFQTDLRLARKEHIPTLRKCCGQFPTPDGLCDSYINFINPIYDDMDAKLTSEQTCNTFGVCPSSLTTNVTIKQSTIDKVEPDCLLCKQVFKLVDKVIQRQAKIDIEMALDKVCDIILPSSRRKGCRKYVDTYTTKLINFIRKHTDPDIACHLMGMCKEDPENLISLLSKLNSSNKPKVFSPDDCDNCFKSVAWAAVTIEDYATSINGMLTNACLEYTHDDDLCKKYMADHFDSVTKELISKTSVHYFCINLFGLCPEDLNN